MSPQSWQCKQHKGQQKGAPCGVDASATVRHAKTSGCSLSPREMSVRQGDSNYRRRGVEPSRQFVGVGLLGWVSDRPPASVGAPRCRPSCTIAPWILCPIAFIGRGRVSRTDPRPSLINRDGARSAVRRRRVGCIPVTPVHVVGDHAMLRRDSAAISSNCARADRPRVLLVGTRIRAALASIHRRAGRGELISWGGRGGGVGAGLVG